MSDVFVLATASGMAETDPAAIVRKALAPLIKRNDPALTSIKEARALLEADTALKGCPITKLASRLLAVTADERECPVRALSRSAPLRRSACSAWVAVKLFNHHIV